MTTSVDAASTGTTLMLASTTGVEEGDFVVVTSDHAPAPAGAYVTSIIFWVPMLFCQRL